jgi:hypothetical protein
MSTVFLHGLLGNGQTFQRSVEASSAGTYDRVQYGTVGTVQTLAGLTVSYRTVAVGSVRGHRVIRHLDGVLS